ncbi:ATP-binding protein [Nodosilinea sp. PGN35]|uniref:ATP-binding protein n=1 Tax=Nodosilinea sp. PGN35 TaxID=3020489 RepID=UPI0023B235BA|nr:ATP-binding protein [Nodosilinea sp. TSF1-S3]MDF0367045.1 ATP-binding protein [Nodosilinea sp. TSF1-S3]
MTAETTIKAKDRNAIIQSLRAGVVPRSGQHLIQVGRVRELEALIKDINHICDEGATVRFVIGNFGSGKTFFLSLVRTIALQKKLVTVHADLNPNRRLHSSKGQARSLYAELMRNLSTRAKPEGGALSSVVEKFVSSAMTEARSRNVNPEVIIRERLDHLSEMVGGYDFAEVIAAYWRGHDTGDDVLKSNAVRWLRGEFSTKTDAKKALGVRTIVDDANFYDQLKLFARFVRLAGYEGFVVCLDELVNLYKLANTQARNSNYEQILRILNDSLQGTADGLGFVLGGTPEFLMDTRKGLYSYEALQTRLAENTFAGNGIVDFSHPVIRLASLSQEDLYVLLTKIRHVFAEGNADAYLISDAEIQGFMQHCFQRVGEAYFRTPRNTITAFVNLLAVLDQNPEVSVEDLVGKITIEPEQNPDLLPFEDDGQEDTPTQPSPTETVSEDVEADDDLASFKL